MSITYEAYKPIKLFGILIEDGGGLIASVIQFLSVLNIVVSKVESIPVKNQNSNH